MSIVSSAIRSFLCALYKDTHFERVNEIHLRLGLLYSQLNDPAASLKHFQLALLDTAAPRSSLTKHELTLCIAQLHELSGEHADALDKYEELAKGGGSGQERHLDSERHLVCEVYRVSTIKVAHFECEYNLMALREKNLRHIIRRNKE